MAGEFTKRVDNGQNIWTCQICHEEIVTQSKPRAHICRNHTPRPSPPPQPTFPYTPHFSHPPPGYSTPGQGFQPMNGQGIQPQAEMDALFRFQQLQAEQNKQMMIFFQQQNQEMMNRQEEQSLLKMNQMMDMMKLQKQSETKIKCPKWEKEENVKNFLSRLKRWNEIEKGRGKYLLLLESLQESERKREKQRVELEVQNGQLDPENENVILNVIDKLKKWFGKTRIDEASEAWKQFRDMKKSSEEKIDTFLLRFETAESQLKSSAAEIPNIILALQLLESVGATSDQKRNIMVHVNLDNLDTVYDEMKTSLRLLKGNLVEDQSKAGDEDEINFSKNDYLRRQRSRSKSKPRFENRSFDEENQGRDRTTSRERGRSRERRFSQERSPHRNRSYSRQREYGKRDYSRDRYRGGEKKRSYENVNLVFKETGDEAKAATKDNHDRMIVDSGTTKTVSGEKWMKTYLESLSEEERSLVSEENEERFFRFGNSIRYPSTKEVTIPIKMGKLESQLHVSVVEASIPLLIGKPDLKKFGFIINFEDETVFTTRTFEMFPLETTVKGHLAIPIKDEESLDEDIFLLAECDKAEKIKKITKIHQVLAHTPPEILKEFFKNSSDNEKEVLQLVDEIIAKCNVCKRFKRTPSRPKVGLPVSCDFNECVALDLKERKGNKEYILYCICTFSRLTRGVIIKDKNPHTIVKGVLDCWVLGKGIGPGIPGKFLFDNGGEFNNAQVIDLAEKHGIKMHGTTAAHSPFSNGLCEKNHEVVDKSMAKMMADDKSMKPVDALEHALFAKNVEPNNKGFSSFQIVYGNNPTIPGITNSTPPSLSTEYTSKHVRDHIGRINKAREAFRNADNDDRIKRALKSRIASYNHEKYASEDKVYFKEKDKIEWSGPATVIGQQGKVVFLKYGNNLRRVHMSRIIRVGEEYRTNSQLEKETKQVVQETNREENESEVVEDEEEKVPVERPQRRASVRRPEKSRQIIFHPVGREAELKHALVKDVGHKTGTKQFQCTLVLDNLDEQVVDFSERKFIWEYEKFPCDRCDQKFDTKRSLKMHKSKLHKETQSQSKKTVHFEAINFTENKNTHECNECDQKFNKRHDLETHHETKHSPIEENNVNKLKVRFKEIMDERNRNEEWITKNNEVKNEEINYAEIKETAENSERVQEAKAKELSNFDDYETYEEVKYDGQEVLGTRYVLTEKADGSIKARFVTKGFQEEFFHPSDSPTSSRETVKIFLAIAGNEKWSVESSDVRSAFLQSEMIDRDVFVEPPEERKKPGIIWKLRKPVYGLNDASRKWFLSFKNTLFQLGMKQSQRESCLFYFQKENKLHGFLIIHVDDVLSAGSKEFLPVIEKLRSKYTFGKVEQGTFVYTGLNIHQTQDKELFVNQNDFVDKLTMNEFSSNEPDHILEKNENRMVRKSQGQLSWLATQTRPDLSFDAFNLSTKLNRATLRDGKLANKVVKKAKQEKVQLKFSSLGNINDLHLELFADASLGNVEAGVHTKSGMGYFICLANKNLKMSPLHWKSCVIDKVAEDIKTAETLALEKALDDAIHISNLITEIYTGEPTMNTLPIVANEDSNSLLESIYSTKKVKRKTMRVVVSSIQQHLQNKILTKIHHVKSKDNIADVFTKAGVNTDRVLNALQTGSLFHETE